MFQVHGDLHGLLGGGFDCNTDMDEFAARHPEYSARLLSFVLEYMTFNYWPMNGFISSANTCDTDCTRGQTEPCGCTCNIDAFAISDQEVHRQFSTQNAPGQHLLFSYFLGFGKTASSFFSIFSIFHFFRSPAGAPAASTPSTSRAGCAERSRNVPG